MILPAISSSGVSGVNILDFGGGDILSRIVSSSESGSGRITRDLGGDLDLVDLRLAPAVFGLQGGEIDLLVIDLSGELEEYESIEEYDRCLCLLESNGLTECFPGDDIKGTEMTACSSRGGDHDLHGLVCTASERT